MKLRRTLALCLSLILAMGALSACGSSAPAATEAPATTAAAADAPAATEATEAAASEDVGDPITLVFSIAAVHRSRCLLNPKNRPRLRHFFNCKILPRVL